MFYDVLWRFMSLQYITINYRIWQTSPLDPPSIALVSFARPATLPSLCHVFGCIPAPNDPWRSHQWNGREPQCSHNMSEIHRNTQTESNWTLNWFRIWEVSSGSQRMDIEIELMQNPMYFHIFLTHQERMPNSPDSSLTQQVHRKQSYAWVPLRNMPGLGWPLNLQLSFVGETTGIQSTFYVADCCRAYEPDITWPSERELWIELA